MTKSSTKDSKDSKGSIKDRKLTKWKNNSKKDMAKGSKGSTKSLKNSTKGSNKWDF